MKAAVNTALVVKAVASPPQLVAKKAAARMRWHWMRPLIRCVPAHG